MLTVIVVVGALLTAIPLFIGSLMLGLFAIPKAQPAYLMYAWDAIVVAFLFFWMIGLITELQRTDPLSLSKFMHLPVSANGAFLINYLSSLLRLSLIIFLPVMLGFALALVVVKGICDAAGPAARRGFLADGHGPDLSVSGMAGFAHEQPPPPANGDHGCDADLRLDRAGAQLAELHVALGATRAARPPGPGHRPGNATAETAMRRRGESTQTSSRGGSRKSSNGKGASASRQTTKAWNRSSARPVS